MFFQDFMFYDALKGTCFSLSKTQTFYTVCKKINNECFKSILCRYLVIVEILLG